MSKERRNQSFSFARRLIRPKKLAAIRYKHPEEDTVKLKVQAVMLIIAWAMIIFILPKLLR